eukprot:CAMPEP_0171635382 /NCGR_PEP_ID=MMETSP0990-20121206/26630_1 /TAXON_ID=483369 /ORGANISM="non described non described, Strain CCMP2098" /LENGTH=63 /DNA_ID=CAMNT_0012207009 /DNA_START=145 /DNA_END=336 /DNA_ORIENTATION=+
MTGKQTSLHRIYRLLHPRKAFLFKSGLRMQLFDEKTEIGVCPFRPALYMALTGACGVCISGGN